MLTVGVDSYVTIEEANTYIARHYLPADERSVNWASLSDEDKEVYLLNACAELSKIKWRGVAFKAFQPLPFPRYFGNNWVFAYYDLIAPEVYIYPELREVPKNILSAQIEEAFELACPSEDTEAFEAENGKVQSYTIGHLTENYKSAQDGSVKSVIKSKKAQELVADYTGGAYEIQ